MILLKNILKLITIPLYNIGWQIYIKMWENGNILFCNNSDAVKVQIIIKEIGNETYTITQFQCRTALSYF